MIGKNRVDKPLTRSRLRRLLGREYYIIKRCIRWMVHHGSYARLTKGHIQEIHTPHTLATHRSPILRKLKDVDMYLQHNKATNLRLAAARIDGVVIHPGQRLSVWKLVGRPTARKGYLEGLVIENGRVSKGTGGGLCQLGNLLYWMALHTDLDVTERWRHSFDLFPDSNRTVPFACGATLGYNYLDLEITNNTPYTYSVGLRIEEGFLCGEIRCDTAVPHSFEIFETDHRVEQQWWGGYTRHNRIWRRRTNTVTGESSEMLVSENHAIMMYNPLLPQ